MDLPKNIETPKLTENGLIVLQKRFLQDFKNGNIQTPKERFWQIAMTVAKADKKYDEKADVVATAKTFYGHIAKRMFVPASPTIANAGKEKGQLSSCFVLPVEDSIQGIYKCLSEAAIVQKSGGGTGFDFSSIRPGGDVVEGSGDIAQGPISVLKTFNQALGAVRQGGKRQGGNMGILRVDHPDILEFIDCKEGEDEIRNFNVSVAVTDVFIKALEQGAEYQLINPHSRKVVKTLKAKQVWDKLVKNAWENGEPGVIFIDTINRHNSLPELGKMAATNPCGEQPLFPYESCNLAHINLERCVRDGKIARDILEEITRVLVHFMDNIIEVNEFPLAEIAEMNRQNRKIGIGVMGFADMLFRMKISYGSERAEKLAGEIMEFIRKTARNESQILASKRGVFPNYDKSVFAKKGIKLRHAAITTVAPTGVTSIIGGTTPGVEPSFGLVSVRQAFYDKSHKGTTVLKEVNPILKAELEKRKIYSEELLEKIFTAGTLQGLKEIPEELKKYFQVSADIAPEWHIRIQAAFQKYTDTAVSKTINFPHEATVKDIADAYRLAYDSGCKGVTVYRDGSRQEQVVSTGNTKKGKPVPAKALPDKSVGLTEIGLRVLEKRALKKDKTGEIIETTRQLWERVTDFIIQAEDQYVSPEETKKIREDFVNMQDELKFLCGGTLIFAGQRARTLSKCFVLPIDDSVDDIFNMVRDNIQILRKGGGTGFNLSRLRSSKAVVESTGEHAAGPVEFLKAINATMDTITGRGGRQMGAMAILNIDHPNIREFIKCKDKEGAVSHLNISVGMTGEFMLAVKNDTDFNLVDPHTKKVMETVKARDLFRLISEHAWNSGDPGLVFVDTINNNNTVPGLGRMEATNPCGEQPLFPYESCNLGNVALPRFVEDGKLNWKELERIVRLGVRFLDDVIDVNEYPLSKIKENSALTRKAGLGVMGFADLLIKMGIPYNSEEAVKQAETIMSFVTRIARNESVELGKKRGSFPAFEKSIFVGEYEAMRNATVTTVCPTGTISLVAGCSAGIEPNFAISYTMQNYMGGDTHSALLPEFERVAKEKGFYSKDLIKKVEAEGGVQHIDEVPEDVKKIFVTAHDISPEWHIKIQAAFQKHTDNAVSKTVNFPETGTIEGIEKVYKLAHETGCKGVTVYRDNCKKEQVYSAGSTATADSAAGDDERASADAPDKHSPRKRPEVTKGSTEVITTGCGPLMVTINEDEDGVCEVFANVGKSGGCSTASAEAIGRLASNSLRAGVPIDVVIDQLEGIRCPSPYTNKDGTVHSCADGISKVLTNYVERKNKLDLKFPARKQVSAPKAESEPVIEKKQDKQYSRDNNTSGYNPVCPDCGAMVEFSEGCLVCRSCGYSKCG